MSKKKRRDLDLEVETVTPVSYLQGNELADCIAQLIAECAEELELKPQQVALLDLKKYAKKQDLGLKPADITRAGGFAMIRDAYFPPVPAQPSVETQRLKEQARFHRKLNNEAIRNHYMMQSIEEHAAKVFTGRVIPFVPKARFGNTPVSRMVNAVWSDLHFGSEIREDETGHNYGRKEEARRMAAVVKQIMSYKMEYREQTGLNVLLLGDIIQNQLHDMRDGSELADQTCRAIHILSQAIAHLASSFQKVAVHCSSGNHGRNKSRHMDRAIHQKWDSIETIVYYALKAACAKLSNVTFHIPKTPFFVYDVFGSRIFGTHGDTVLKPGYPGRAINVASLEHQINRLNASLPDSEEYSVAVMGHVHVASMTHLPSGPVVITNGALVPPDDFAVSMGQLECQTGQWLFESVPGFPVGDARLIRVDETHDQDPSLDAIISPWPGL
jgi:hypothetical protein